MKDPEAITRTAAYIEQKFKGGEAAHDWWHIYRVWRLAIAIAAQEKGANLLVVELGALLHDIADWKFHDGDTTIGPRLAREWLDQLGVSDAVAKDVVEIVEHISFRGGTNQHVMQTLEAKIVQDADRLDAMGAIGIARVFAFGGSHGRELYDPDNAPRQYKNFEEFRAALKGNTSVNHFYEKLLVLKDRMNTKTGRALAEHRHVYMEGYLQEFYDEWEGRL